LFVDDVQIERRQMPTLDLDTLQLRTTKVNKLSILGTRIFDGNLTTDLKLDRQKVLKTGLFILFPRVFGRAKILSDILSFGNCSNRGCRVHQDIDDHHDHLINCPVLLLLACSSSAGQSLAVRTHKPPRSVYETLYNLFWAFFKEALLRFLGVLEGFLLHFVISVLTPTPVLALFLARGITH
jgi:hypothetical protein